jgi:hypothetical protein
MTDTDETEVSENVLFLKDRATHLRTGNINDIDMLCHLSGFEK